VIIVPETLPSTTIDTFPTFLIGPNGSGKIKWQGTLRETRPIYFAYMPAKPTYDPNFTVKKDNLRL